MIKKGSKSGNFLIFKKKMLFLSMIIKTTEWYCGNEMTRLLHTFNVPISMDEFVIIMSLDAKWVFYFFYILYWTFVSPNVSFGETVTLLTVEMVQLCQWVPEVMLNIFVLGRVGWGNFIKLIRSTYTYKFMYWFWIALANNYRIRLKYL